MAGVSLKEKALVLDRVCNSDPIITKLCTHVGPKRIQIEFVDELCRLNGKGRTFLRKKTFDTH